MMQLPGGLVINGRRNQHFKLVSSDGWTDMQLYELLADADSQPHWVSEAILLVLEQLANTVPSIEQVRSLCLADRQAIALAWRLQTQQAEQWVSHYCGACGEIFDISIPMDGLPFSPAGEGFPFARLHVNGQELIVRVPDGDDLEALAQISDAQSAREHLAQRVIVERESINFSLTEKEILSIEAAIESIVPELATEITSDCPECGAANTLLFDPYEGLVKEIDPLLDDVHLIAQAYHWTENEILSLPEIRRQQYLQRIEYAQGVSGGLL